MLSRVLKALAAYLGIGVIVTMIFIGSTPMHMGAAPLIVIGPFIWPVLGATMLGEAVDKALSARQGRKRADTEFAERMAWCPAGYAVPCEIYYSLSCYPYMDRRETPHSFSEGEALLHAELFRGNIPDNPDARLEIAKMLRHFTPVDMDECLAKLRPFFDPGLSPATGYVAAWVLLERVDGSLEWTERDYNKDIRDEWTERKRVLQAEALQLIIPACERFLKSVSLSETDAGMASLYKVYADRLPPGRERDEALRALKDRALNMMLHGEYLRDLWQGLFYFLSENKDWQDIEPVLAELEASFARGRELKKFRGHSETLPALRVAMRYGYQGKGPFALLAEDFWPLLKDPETLLLSSYYLVPLVGHGSGNSDYYPGNGWRRVFYDKYLESGDQRWVDMCLKSIRDKCPEASRHIIPFVEAEVLYIKGRTHEAEKLLREYFRGEKGYDYCLTGGWGIEGLKSWDRSPRNMQFVERARQIASEVRWGQLR